MKTDIEIAQEAVMEPITKVAESIGIEADDLELYGKYKAKLSEEFLRKIQDRPNGKLILVTAINPTPAGEGKTTTTVGMGEAFGRMGKKAVIALREPSLGPCFGIKGGAAGGGYAQVVPMDELNLHFTGDFHAITSANNLLAALLDNHIQQGNDLGIDTRQIVWKRCEDMNDRVLRNIVVGRRYEGSEGAPVQNRCGLQLSGGAGDRRPAESSRCHGSTVKGCHQAQSDPDLRAYSRIGTRRSVCQYRSRM